MQKLHGIVCESLNDNGEHCFIGNYIQNSEKEVVGIIEYGKTDRINSAKLECILGIPDKNGIKFFNFSLRDLNKKVKTIYERKDKESPYGIIGQTNISNKEFLEMVEISYKIKKGFANDKTNDLSYIVLEILNEIKFDESFYKNISRVKTVGENLPVKIKLLDKTFGFYDKWDVDNEKAEKKLMVPDVEKELNIYSTLNSGDLEDLILEKVKINREKTNFVYKP